MNFAEMQLEQNKRTYELMQQKGILLWVPLRSILGFKAGESDNETYAQTIAPFLHLTKVPGWLWSFVNFTPILYFWYLTGVFANLW